MKIVERKVIFSFRNGGKLYEKGDNIKLNEQDAAKLEANGMIKSSDSNPVKKKAKKNSKED